MCGESKIYLDRCRVKDLGVSPVIAVILMLAITVVLSGLLWSMLQIDNVNPDPLNITATIDEANKYWKLEIASISSNEYTLDDTFFEMRTNEGINKYKLLIKDSDPDAFNKDFSKVYPLSINNTVKDRNTGKAVTNATTFINYIGCYIAFLDTNADYRLSPGDLIYIYKDYNNDGINEIKPTYSLVIRINNRIAINQPFI